MSARLEHNTRIATTESVDSTRHCPSANVAVCLCQQTQRNVHTQCQLLSGGNSKFVVPHQLALFPPVFVFPCFRRQRQLVSSYLYNLTGRIRARGDLLTVA